MSNYPVRVEVVSPDHFDRLQLLIRLCVVVALAWIGITAGWLIGLLFFALPIIAAIAISSEGSDGYMTRVAPQLWHVLAWLLRLAAYMSMLVDRFPTFDEQTVTPTITFTGRPTTESALLRIVTSVPSGLVLVILWCVSNVACVIAVLCVLVGASVPSSVLAFQRGVLRWQARLVAYHASLVAEYPPWSFEMEPSDAALAAAGAR